MEPLKNLSMTYSFSQSYPGWTQHTAQPSALSLLAELEQIDRWVDCMHSYPDAQQLLEKLT